LYEQKTRLSNHDNVFEIPQRTRVGGYEIGSNHRHKKQMLSTHHDNLNTEYVKEVIKLYCGEDTAGEVLRKNSSTLG
jgi:hypothetical protein